MNINKKNYEAFIIDYFDGKLDPVESAELISFLSQNPDLEAEFNDYKCIRLNLSSTASFDKSLLKKDYSDIENINNENFEEFCIAKFEGDLSDRDEFRLREYIKDHPEKQKDFEIYSNIHLTPDYSIKFYEKNNIKKISPFVRRRNVLLYASSIAAAILILLMLVFMPWKEKEILSGSQAAENVAELNNAPRKEYENNNVVAERLALTEQKIDSREKIRYKRPEEKLPARGQNINQVDKKGTPGYLTPIYVNKINTDKDSDIIMRAPLIATKNLYNNKYGPIELAVRNLINTSDTGDSWIKLNKINVWRLAEAGVKSFNYLTESEVLISKKMNNEGKIVAFALDSESFSISSNRGK